MRVLTGIRYAIGGALAIEFNELLSCFEIDIVRFEIILFIV